MPLETVSPVLPQGIIVSFEIPQGLAVGSELSGRQLGVVISHDKIKSRINSLLVAPFLTQPSLLNDELGIPASPEGLDGWIRPDLTRTVGRQICSPVRRKGSPNKSRLTVPYDKVVLTNKRLLELIGPTSEKFQRGHSPLGYGEVAWFRGIPRASHPWIEDKAPGVCISSPKLYEKTGIALICRRFSNVLNAVQRYDVLSLSDGFNPGYYQASNFYALSLSRVRDPRTIHPNIGYKKLGEIKHRIAASLEEDAFREAVKRYSDERGRLPPSFEAARHHPHSGPRTRTGAVRMHW